MTPFGIRMFSWFCRLAWLAALLSAGTVCAQSSRPEDFVGRSFWYEPKHERYAATDFYRSPKWDTDNFHITIKTQLRVLGANRRGWLLLRVDGSGKGPASDFYIHATMFKSRLYSPITGEGWDSFARAALFEQDPKEIEAQFKDDTPTRGAKAGLPPWKKYRENWQAQKSTEPRKSGARRSDGKAQEPASDDPSSEASR